MNSLPDSRVPVVVMASGTGSLLAAILAAADEAPFAVAGVVSDRECAAVGIAADAGVPVSVCRPADHADRTAWDAALTETVAGFAPEWVVTAGFMRILGAHFLGRFGGHVLNSHPALLPAFPGAHGVADALAHGVKVTGCTVHLVDDGVDTGPILAQQVVTVADDDTVESLHERIKEVERELLPSVVAAVVAHGVVTDGRKAYIP